MSKIFNTVYVKMREKEVGIAKRRLQRIMIDSVFQSISRSCWHYGIKDEVLIKNHEMLLIKLTGKKNTSILKYHKTDMVFLGQFEKFLLDMECNEVSKGIYITTGTFHRNVKRYCNLFSSIENVQLVDYSEFLIKQLGLLGSAADTIKKERISFMEYMPD